MSVFVVPGSLSLPIARKPASSSNISCCTRCIAKLCCGPWWGPHEDISAAALDELSIDGLGELSRNEWTQEAGELVMDPYSNTPIVAPLAMLAPPSPGHDNTHSAPDSPSRAPACGVSGCGWGSTGPLGLSWTPSRPCSLACDWAASSASVSAHRDWPAHEGQHHRNAQTAAPAPAAAMTHVRWASLKSLAEPLVDAADTAADAAVDAAAAHEATGPGP